MRRFVLTVFVAGFFSSMAMAQTIGLLGGLNFAGAEATENGFSLEFEREMGFQAGMRYLHDLGEVQLRTGAQISMHKMSANLVISGFPISAELSATQLHIPITVQKMVTPAFGIFGGAGLSLNLSDDYEVNNQNSDPELESLWLALQVGAIYMFSEQIGAEFVFDYGLSDLAENTTGNILSFQIIYFFS